MCWCVIFVVPACAESIYLYNSTRAGWIYKRDRNEANNYNGTADILRFTNVPVPELTLYFAFTVVEPAVKPVSRNVEPKRRILVPFAAIAKESEAACVLAPLSTNDIPQ